MNSLLSWQYSRNQLRHWVAADGELYQRGKPRPSGYELFEIKTDRPPSVIRKRTDRFRLLHKGKLVDSHAKVKVLKETAERIYLKTLHRPGIIF